MVLAPAAQQKASSSETATLACGCFWSPDAKFAKLDGVLSTRVGYTGGSSPDPTYNSVCSGDGHTEAVKVEFNPEQLPYDGLLKVFFKEHDPTLSKGKPQYKSAIWYHTEQQKEVAEQMIKEISSKSSKPVATDLAPATHWTDAEDYHQNYYHKSGM